MYFLSFSLTPEAETKIVNSKQILVKTRRYKFLMPPIIYGLLYEIKDILQDNTMRGGLIRFKSQVVDNEAC